MKSKSLKINLEAHSNRRFLVAISHCDKNFLKELRMDVNLKYFGTLVICIMSQFWEVTS